MTKGLKIAIISIVGAIVLTAGIVFGAFYYINNTKEYKASGDYIPSIKEVLGNRTVISYKSTRKNGVYTQTYYYKNIDDVKGDLIEYTNYLRKVEYFKVLKSFDLNDSNNTSIYLGKTSHVDSEYIVLLDIEYTDNSYNIVITKKKGEIVE